MTRPPKKPSLDRRSFLASTGIGALATALPASALPSSGRRPHAPESSLDTASLRDASWDEIRSLFPLTDDYVYMVHLLLASHPKPVQDEIDRISKGLNENPALYLLQHYRAAGGRVREACADFLSVRAEDVGLTDSTTMGLGVLYGGLDLDADDDILSTTHDHVATHEALQLTSRRTGAAVRRIALYDRGRDTDPAVVVRRMIDALQPNTRIVATTWVHSATGVKLPIRAMADALARANRSRKQPVRLFVDGVHGFGIENVVIEDLGCDAFAAGCHKWIWGPRGTGLVWGNEHAWQLVRPTMTAFEQGVQDAFLAGEPTDDVPMAWRITPGGFHSFENRWALPKAFELQQAIGRQRIQDRIHGFTRHLVAEMARMPHVTLHTPARPDLQSGMVCFEVEGYTNEQTIRHLVGQGVIGSTTPYNPTYARFTPGAINTEQEVEIALEKVAAMRGTQPSAAG